MAEYERDMIDELSERRAAGDPAYAALHRRMEMVWRLLPVRKALGLTQEQVAERMGVSRAQVAALETRPHKASLDAIARYADALGARIELVLPDSVKAA